MGGGAWRATVHGVAESRTPLNGPARTQDLQGNESVEGAGGGYRAFCFNVGSKLLGLQNYKRREPPLGAEILAGDPGNS